MAKKRAAKKLVTKSSSPSLAEIEAERERRKQWPTAKVPPSKNFIAECTPIPEQVPYAGGQAASSKIAPFHLIPTVALESLANRFQKGIERKGDKSWNAISQNQEILVDREFAIERTSHIILHAQKLRDKLLRGEDLIGDDDDAGAIMWAGAFFACVANALNRQNQKRS